MAFDTAEMGRNEDVVGWLESVHAIVVIVPL